MFNMHELIKISSDIVCECICDYLEPEERVEVLNARFAVSQLLFCCCSEVLDML